MSAPFTTINCSVLLAAFVLGSWAALSLLRNGRKAGWIAACALGPMVLVAINLFVTDVQARDASYGLAAVAFVFFESLIMVYLGQLKSEKAT